MSLLKQIKQIVESYKGPEENLMVEEKTPFSISLEEKKDYFRKKFGVSADLTFRDLDIYGTAVCVITIEGLVNKANLADGIVLPLLQANFSGINTDLEKYKVAKTSVLAGSEQVELKYYEQALFMAMSGFALMAFDGVENLLAFGVQGFNVRSIAEPSNEVMQRGSKEGFVEASRINMTLLRRRIKNPNFKFEVMQVGTISKTEICLCYLEEMVSKTILGRIKKRIKNINLKTVLAAEYILPFLEENKDLSLFSSVGISERPDTVCGKILEGRVAILVDGTPSAIIVPYLFIEYFQTMDDYAVRPYFATLTRWLKYLSFFVSLILPGLYVALGTFNPEVFPDQFISKLARSVADTPLPLVLETLVILFVYEIMREAGLRLPRSLGHAVGIIGGLVIGQTAVSAGLMGSPTLIVVALTAICSYIIPSLYEPVALLRFLFIIVGGTLGIWGVMLLFSVVLINICSKENYDIPFLAPVAPFKLGDMRDVAFRMGWKKLARKTEKIQDMPGSNVKG